MPSPSSKDRAARSGRVNNLGARFSGAALDARDSTGGGSQPRVTILALDERERLAKYAPRFDDESYEHRFVPER